MNQVLGHLTEEERKIEERAYAATEGPWIQSYFQPLYVTREDTREVASVAQFNDDGSVDILFAKDRIQAGANVRFIASARADIPTLLSTINALRERVEAAEGWVAVKDRKPNAEDLKRNDGWVLLFVLDDYDGNTNFVNVLDVSDWDGEDDSWDQVSHWRPLPPSPKAEEQSNGK